MPAGQSDSNEFRERIARSEQQAIDFERRLEETKSLVKSFAEESGARIRWEAKLEAKLDSALVKVDEVEERLDEMEVLARDRKKFSTTTKITLGGLALTAGSLVVAVIALVH